MVKKISGMMVILSLAWGACVTYQPPPPTLYIEAPPPAAVMNFSLDERIAAEEAWSKLRSGDIKQASKIFNQLGSGNPLYFAGMGYVYYIQQDLATAEDYFKAAAREFPDLAIGHVGLAQIYQETGRDDMAFTEFREILKTEPDHPWALPRMETTKKNRTDESLYDAKTLLAGGDIKAAKTSFLKALYYSPDSIEAHIALGTIYLEEKAYKESMVHLNAVLAREPENLQVLEYYAEALFQAEDWTKALEQYELLKSKAPDNQTAREKIEALKNRLGIFELPSQYDAISMKEAVTKEDLAALIGVKFQDILESPPRKPPIIIDISTSWAARFILKIATLEILDIYPNHTFQPKKTITRAEMAETLYRLTDVLQRKGYSFTQQIPTDRIRIADVSMDNYYYRPILAMISYEIMGLSSGRNFKPDQALSGQEAGQVLDIILALIKSPV